MGKKALHALIDQISEKEVNHVYYFLSLVVNQHERSFEGMTFEEAEPLPDEIEAYEEYKQVKALGEKFATHEDVWNKKASTKVA